MNLCSACDVDLCEVCGHDCECHHTHQHYRPAPQHPAAA
jgi:hypothetical protein